MKKADYDPRLAASLAATREIKEWCTANGTLCIVTPLNRYYVVLFDADGEAPIIAYFGQSAIATANRLKRRGSALYATDPFGDPPNLGAFN